MLDGGRAIDGVMGIGHTRWATHGEPSDTNSHPHLSKSGRFAVVHNGIIENYLKLREYLTKKGFEFISETDTEVIAHLVEYYYTGDIVDTLIKVINKVEDLTRSAFYARIIPNLSTPFARKVRW